MADHTSKTIHAYNRSAQAYADRFMNFAPYRDQLLHFQQHYLAQGMRILDLGCGPGNNAQHLLQHDPSVQLTGIDLSEEMLRLARQNVPQAHFIHGDLRDLPTQKTYQAILAAFCIVHLKQEETTRLLATIARLLEPGGTMYLSFMEGKPEGLETTGFSDQPLYFNYYNRAWVEEHLTAAGLVVSETHTADYTEPDGSVTTDVFVYAHRPSV